MLIYIIIFIVLSVFSIIESTVNLKRKHSITIASLFIMAFWIMSFIRWERGADWGNYHELFSYYANDYNTVNYIGYEWGFFTINYIIRQFTSDYNVLLFVLSFILFYSLRYVINRIATRPILSILVLYSLYFGYIFFTRQNIAAAIILISFYYIVKQDKKRFILYILIASLFHASAIIFIPAYWLYFKRIKNNHLLIIFFLSLILSVLLSKVLLAFISGLPGIIGAKVMSYMKPDGDYEEFGQSIFRVLLGGIINRGAILILALFILNKERNKSSYVNGIINLYSFGFIIFIMTAPVAVALTRGAAYYDILSIFLFPLILENVKIRHNRLIISIIFVMYFCFRLFIGTINGPYGKFLTPYNTIFTKEIFMEIG